MPDLDLSVAKSAALDCLQQFASFLEPARAAGGHLSKEGVYGSALDQELRLLVERHAQECCRLGIAPILLYAPTFTGVATLAEALEKRGLARGGSFMLPPPIYTALECINERIRQEHLHYLLDREAYRDALKSESQELAALVNTDEEDDGLIAVRALSKLESKFRLHLAPAIPGVLNSSLPLSDTLAKISGLPSIELSIRIDHFRITPLRSGEGEYLEKGATYGRPFDRAWLRNLRGIQTAQHDHSHGVRGDTMQFLWEELGSYEVAFACEELPFKFKPNEVSEIVGTRFIHGIFDKRLDQFSHFDGAVHFYEPSNYKTRLESHLKAHFKDYRKAKIFRADGGIPFELAEELLAAFYRWNDLAPEYFCPRPPTRLGNR